MNRSACKDLLKWAMVAAVVVAAGEAEAGQWEEMRVLVAPANAGLVGYRHPVPYLELKTSAVVADPKAVPPVVGVPARYTVRENSNYSWVPSISVGIIFRTAKYADTVAGGVGFHFVTFSHDGDTRVMPAITAHLGTEDKQLFVGPMFGPRDEVKLDPNPPTIGVLDSEDLDDYVTKGTGIGWHIYAGVALPLSSTADEAGS